MTCGAHENREAHSVHVLATSMARENSTPAKPSDVVDEPFEHSEASGAAYDVGVHREHEGASVVVGSLESGGPDVVDVCGARHDGDLDPRDGA